MDKAFTFATPTGVETKTFQLIVDGDRVVALYTDRPQIDLITHDPEQAPKLEGFSLPSRYHNQTFLNTRITTITWVDFWGISGDEHHVNWTEGGETISLTETQVWRPDGKHQRTGRSANTFTVRLDPRLGYVVDADCLLEVDKLPTERRSGKPNRKIEFTNMLARDMSTPWVGRWRFDHTVYTPAPTDRYGKHPYAGWANNVIACDQSDNRRTITIRPGGFMAFLSETEPSPALSRFGEYTFTNQTCNVWQDQHNGILLPEQPDADGMFRANPRFRLQYLPPKVAKHILAKSTWEQFDGQDGVIIPMGQPVDFEDQPVKLATSTLRGASTHGLRVAEGTARSGKRALIIKAKPNQQHRGNFMFLPQINLTPNTTYQLEAWVKLEGDVTASITADLYEWSPHNPERLRRQETNRVEPADEWQRLTLTFSTEETRIDPFVDLRFRVIGEGRAFFDDFQLVEAEQQAD